ncbi:unnamed protein product [Peniophora sp. CBMAI 1063]|nr:unnamed protein product [Peniophora sp. CBMAI 1063]
MKNIAPPPQIYTVPFWPSVLAPPVVGLYTKAQDYAQVLAHPHRTPFLQFNADAHYPVDAGDPAEELWRRSTVVMGLDVRIDPNTKAGEPAASRFPELVSISLAESVEELRPILQDPVGRNAGGSRELDNKVAARRSIAFRDGQFFAQDRERSFNSQYSKALYDTLRYTLRPTPSHRVQELVFAKDSWLPDSPAGYQHVLESFTALKAIHFDSPTLPGGVEFDGRVEGGLAFEHVYALAWYLNTAARDGQYPCPTLDAVHLQTAPDTVLDGLLQVVKDTLMNSSGRTRSGLPHIRLVRYIP